MTSMPGAAVRAERSAGLWPTFAYGLLGLPLAFAALPMYVHLPQLYGQHRGVDLVMLGTLLLGLRAFDALIDPLLGRWSDASRDRRRLMLAGLPLLGLGFAALLRPPADAGLLWLCLTLLPTCFGFSLVSIAYQAWGAECGADSAARSRLTASREACGLVGVLLGAALPLALGPSLPDGLAWLAILFLPLLTLTAAATLLSSGGANRPAVRARGTEAAPAVWREPRFRRLLAVFVANGVAAALPATLVMFYVADVLDAAASSAIFLVIYFVAGAAGLPFWVALAGRIGRVAAWGLAMLAASAVFAVTPFLGPGDGAVFAVVCLLSGLCLGADLVLPAALLADLARADGDAGARAGRYFGWWNLVAKLNLALAAGIALPLLGLAAYVPGQAATAGVLAWLYGGLPVFFKLLALSLLWRWRHSLDMRP